MPLQLDGITLVVLLDKVDFTFLYFYIQLSLLLVGPLFDTLSAVVLVDENLSAHLNARGHESYLEKKVSNLR